MARFEPKGDKVELSPEDQARVALLTQEIVGRVHEQALILSRTAGMSALHPHGMTLEVQPGEPILVRHCDGRGNCICYDYEQQICYMC